MAANAPLPDRHCDACGRGHPVAVPFCPYCGFQQLRGAHPPRDASNDAAPVVGPAPKPAPSHPIRDELAGPPLRRPQPAPRRTPSPARAAAAPASRRQSVRFQHAVAAILVIAGLTCLALELPDRAPRPMRLGIGPAWSAVPLTPFRATPLVRVRGDTAFSLRVDGQRVVRVAPGDGVVIGTTLLRSLELRAEHPVTVTLIPQRD